MSSVGCISQAESSCGYPGTVRGHEHIKKAARCYMKTVCIIRVGLGFSGKARKIDILKVSLVGNTLGQLANSCKM